MIIFSFILSIVAFVAFPESSDAILEKESKSNINIETSGNLGLYYKGKCHKTFGNETVVSNEYSDWCSNIAKDKNDPQYNPWIQYSLKGKQMKISRFSIRYGCCHYSCCCTEENGKVVDYYCCCVPYSYSILGSNDNKTWTVIHKVVKDQSVDYCGIKTVELKEKTQPFTYIRIALDEGWPGCPKCMQLNQVEFYGETVASQYASYSDSSDDDESISIIGRIKKDE